MVRISRRRDADGDVVSVDGRLDATAVPELERVVAWLSGRWRLELAGLRSVDDAGLEVLRALRARGIALGGASPYLRLLLGPEKRRKARAPPSPSEGPRGDGRKEDRTTRGARRRRRANGEEGRVP